MIYEQTGSVHPSAALTRVILFALTESHIVSHSNIFG